MLMVTQTGRGEVAVIDMTNKSILDEDPAAPGTEFLPIGAMPVSIVSTPGGSATFIATAEVGREALFVLPTSCVMPPKSGEVVHDLTQWSACKLPAAPGEMVMVPDTTEDPLGGFRKSCDAPSTPVVADASRSDCPADWDAEERIKPFGRRKILVTLPALGGVALLDARSLYALQPGAFESCPIERWLPLSLQIPTSSEQALPDELENAACPISNGFYFPPLENPRSMPAGIAFRDGHLYVADRGVPLIHELDLGNPCDPHELAPLVPTSIEDENRPVLTSDVAVSELTPGHKRYVYAVDDALGNLMAFDVSPGSTQRRPLVLPGLPYLPFDAPDRINTNLNSARAKDVLFVTHDVPIVDQASSSASTGVTCDPNPHTPTAGWGYRTSSDYSLGANPSKLRGTFAMVALSDGHVSVIDVEDWDQPCRRPVEGNTSTAPNWRGCAGDTESVYTDGSGARTVSDEASCNVIEPHRPRSARFIATNSSVGTGAPSLPSFPTLTTPSGQSPGGSSTRTSSTPKLLAVPYPVSNGTSEVNIGSTRYFIKPSPSEPNGATVLDVSPVATEHHSVILPLIEPRAYLPTENFSLTYEGKLFDDRQTGLLGHSDLSITDPDAQFCDQGVQDIDVTNGVSRQYISADADQAAFVSSHGDFVQITADFSDTDPYWAGLGSGCAADATTGVSGINGCRSYFGTTDNYKATRELTVVEAYQDRLMLQPRGNDPALADNLRCCFAGTVKYTVRAAHQWVFRGQRPLSRVAADATKRCRLDDCSPRRLHIRSRAFEITSSDTVCDEDRNACSCSGDQCIVGIGPKTEDAACVQAANGPVDPNTEAGRTLPVGCIFDSIKARFAVYSGTSPSIRDMVFSWQVTGGFVPYQITLSNNFTGSAVMPQSMTSAPNLNAFFVVDGVSGGVFEFALDPFTINGNPYL
jgi:hypothetical protein